ncbi:MAG: TspO/MBR family protein [Nitrososphaeraceae archaeon]
MNKNYSEKYTVGEMYNKIFIFVVSVSVCQFAGIIGSVFTASTVSTWYPTLIKPEFRCGPVWISLYFLMGYLCI